MGTQNKANVTERNQGESLYTTGDLARLTGNTLRTIRYYEDQGLLNPARRSKGGHRLFSHSSLHRLNFISDLRSLDLPLADIREILQIGDQSRSPSSAAESLFATIETHLDELNEKLNMLRRVRDSLALMKEAFRECKHCRCSWESCMEQECTTQKGKLGTIMDAVGLHPAVPRKGRAPSHDPSPRQGARAGASKETP